VEKPTIYVSIISFTAALAGLLFGLDTAIISGALKFISQEFNLQHQIYIQGYIVSSVLFGAVIGTIFAGFLSRKIGRKMVIILSGILFAAGSLLSSVASSVIMLIFYRVLLGTSVGMAVLITPIYLSEMAPKQYRGRVVSLYQIMVYIGILSAYLIDMYFSSTRNWRWMLGIIAVPAVIMSVLTSFLPQSPRWLAMVNNYDKARDVLKKIRDGQHHSIEKEIGEIKAAVKVKQAGLTTFLRNKNLRRVIFLGIILQFMQQFTGINMVLYYAPKIFALTGLQTNSQQMWATVAVGLVNVISCIGAVYLVDRWGRKPLMYSGFWGMSLSMAGLGFMYYLGPENNTIVQLLTITFIMLFLVTFGFSAGPVVWILCAEIFPLRVRDFSMVVAVLTNWISNFILALSFLSVLDSLGPTFIFGTFAVINLIGIAIVALLLPETKNISLEKIESNLISGKKLRYLGNIS
jgi:SP family galactose:H+ symporter-like MFS transporter